MMDYPVVVTKLSKADGGGYLAVVPDLYGCMSDGETPEEAIRNVQEAISDWLETSVELGRPIPAPGSLAAARAQEQEQVMNTLRDLAESFDGLDGKIERLFDEIEHLREIFENQNAWYRYEKIIAATTERPYPQQTVC